MEDDRKGIEESLNNVIELPKKKSRYLSVVNDETGEVEAYIKLNPKNLGKGWIALYQNSSAWLAQQNLTGEQFKVLFYLFSKLDFDNYLRVTNKEISEWVHIQSTNVSRAMKALKDLGIIVEGSRDGLHKTYRLNPDVAHKGKDRDKNIIEFNAMKNSDD